MARIRAIKPDFFRHEGLYEAEIQSGLPLRIAFAGLWTAADREGRFKWHPRQLKLDCLPYDEIDFGKVLTTLREFGFIQHYEVEGELYGFIPSWSQHQHVNQREAQSSLPEPTDAHVSKAHARIGTHVLARGEGKGKEQEGKGIDIPTRADARRRDVVEFFEKRFWPKYPKREGSNPRKTSLRAFLAAVSAGHDPAKIEAGLDRDIGRWRSANQIGTRFIPLGETWLQQNRWEDHADVEPLAGQTVARSIMPGSPEFQKLFASLPNNSFQRSLMTRSEDTGQPYFIPPEFDAAVFSPESQ